MSIQKQFEQFYENIKLTSSQREDAKKNIMECVKNYTIIIILIASIMEAQNY